MIYKSHELVSAKIANPQQLQRWVTAGLIRGKLNAHAWHFEPSEAVFAGCLAELRKRFSHFQVAAQCGKVRGIMRRNPDFILIETRPAAWWYKKQHSDEQYVRIVGIWGSGSAEQLMKRIRKIEGGVSLVDISELRERVAAISKAGKSVAAAAA